MRGFGMRPKERTKIPQSDMFRLKLVNLIDLRHELCWLGERINWSEWLDEFGSHQARCVIVCRRPAFPVVRRTARLHPRKYTVLASRSEGMEAQLLKELHVSLTVRRTYHTMTAFARSTPTVVIWFMGSPSRLQIDRQHLQSWLVDAARFTGLPRRGTPFSSGGLQRRKLGCPPTEEILHFAVCLAPIDDMPLGDSRQKS
jgi:hypothetical protein